MRQGVRMADPSRFDQRGDVEVGMDVEIDANVVLEGRVVLGDGVRIGPFCRLRDVVLGAGTVVAAHSDLEGVVAGEACTIGPFARLRPGADLAPATAVLRAVGHLGDDFPIAVVVHRVCEQRRDQQQQQLQLQRQQELVQLVQDKKKEAVARFWELLVDFVVMKAAPLAWLELVPADHPFIRVVNYLIQVAPRRG